VRIQRRCHELAVSLELTNRENAQDKEPCFSVSAEGAAHLRKHPHQRFVIYENTGSNDNL